MDDSARICFICKRREDNQLDLGNWMAIENVHVHYFCLLLSKQLPQRGDDNEGAFGFLWPDIVACEQVAKERRCCYCQEFSASARCDDKHCNRFYHVVCGIQHGCLFKFHNAFDSFCDRHLDIKDTEHYIHHHAEVCLICIEPLGSYDSLTSVPSCCNKAWFHRECMQKAALASCRELHCPVCGLDKVGYRKRVMDRGIYVPHTKAVWDSEEEKLNQ